MKNLAIGIGNLVHTVLYAPLSAIGYTHPLHPVLVHFTIGALGLAFVFDYIGLLFRKEALYRTAEHALIFAFPAFLLTGLVGLADWSADYQIASLGSADGPVAAAFGAKYLLAGVLFVLFVIAYFVFRHSTRADWRRHALYLLFFAAVVALGYFGGVVVYG